MASPTNVDVPGMHAGAATIMEKSADLKSSETQVKATIDGLMGSWQGESATSYNTAMGQFYEECNTIINTLKQLSEDVDQSANTYQATHVRNTSIATRLASTIQPGLAGF